MIVSINYSDQNFKKKQQLNSWTAKNIGRVNKVIEYSPSDIDDAFFEANKEILSQKRGGGCWLWKPYIILKTLNELNDGDFLLYVDSGIQFIKNIKGLVEKLDVSGQDVMLFELPLVEVQWTKKQVFDYFKISKHDFLYSNQIMGSLLCFKRSDESMLFVEKWLKICQNKELLYPSRIEESQEKSFIEHREDQSLLSVVAKLNNINRFSDPTDYGKFPHQYLANNRFFYTKEYEKKYLIEKVYFLHNRKESPFIYYLKYSVKCFVNKFGLKKI